MRKTEIVDIEEIQELLLSFAEGNYTKRLLISEERNERDIIVSGINMLGEELECSTVSKEYFKSIYNAISDTVIVADKTGVINKVNTAAKTNLGIEKEKLLGGKIQDLFPNSKEFNELEKILLGETSFGSFETKYSIGKIHKYFLCTISKINSKFDSQKGILIIIKNISKEKNIEGEILNVIINTEEKEKIRLANDLHDALGQELNSVKMMFDSLLMMNKNSEQFQEVLETCRYIVNDCIENTRRLSYDLMPKSLEDQKLFGAFEELELRNRELLDIILSLPKVEYSISMQKKINIYRIVQEFMSNSLRHGKASEVQIQSYKEGDEIVFILSDNGIGFDINKGFKGRGIKNMLSRLKAIEATHSFGSTAHAGTILKFKI